MYLFWRVFFPVHPDCGGSSLTRRRDEHWMAPRHNGHYGSSPARRRDWYVLHWMAPRHRGTILQWPCNLKFQRKRFQSFFECVGGVRGAYAHFHLFGKTMLSHISCLFPGFLCLGIINIIFYQNVIDSRWHEYCIFVFVATTFPNAFDGKQTLTDWRDRPG